MSNIKDKILNKEIKVNKDKTSVKVVLKIQHCTWRDGDRPILVDDTVALKLLLEEGYEVLEPVKSASFYNDFSGKEKVEDVELEWEFSLKVKKPTRTPTKKKTTLTNDTKSVTVTQKDQQPEDSESVE